jgi:eukaryotic-like serine/threonine-protein kinase
MIDDTSPAASRSNERAPVYYGRYEPLSELGRGTSGVVYKAFDPKLDRLVALKILRPELTSLEESGVGLKQRFHQEAVAAGRLTHPAIVAVHDVGEAESRPFMVMEYIEGGTLADLLLGGQPLPLADAVEIVLQVCAALDYAHRHGVVHRDIKPRNILVGPGVTKVTDFGTARILGASHTLTGTMLGTPAYMSPEMVRGQAADPRSDLFSLGVVLYEAVTGVNPFNAADLAAVLYRIVNVDAPSVRHHHAELPPALDWVLRRALAKEPESRFATATDFAGALRAASNGERRARSFRNVRDVVRDLGRTRILWRPVRVAVGMMVLTALGAVTLAALRGAPEVSRSAAPTPAPVVRREMEPTPRPAPRAATVTPPAAPSPVAGTPQVTRELPRTAMLAPVERRDPKRVARPVTTTVPPPTARPTTPTVAAHVARPVSPVESTPTARPVAAVSQESRCLSVNALPFAEVYVDDRSAGYTPMACLRVPIGDHRVRFEMDGQRSPDRVLKISTRHTPDAPLRLSYDFNSGRFIEQ